MNEANIKNLSFQGKFQSILGGALALVYFLVQGMGAYAAETNFWSERRVKADQQKQWTMARLPLGLPTPKNEILPSFSTRVEKSAFSLPGAGHSTGTPPVFGPLAGAVAPYGDVREVFLSPNLQAPLIVHLQDVHEAPEAQRNLGNLTEALKEFKHISLVGMEGAEGAFDLSPYRQYPNKDINRALADLLMEKGYFSGPEAAAIAAETPMTLWGVENPGDYRANVEALVEAEKNKARMKEVLGRWETAYGNAEQTWASPALKNLSENRRAYLANQKTLGDYVTFLAQGTPASAERLKNIQRLRTALALENRLNFAAVEKERLALVEMLARQLTPQALEGLIQDSLAYRTGRLSFGEYHGALQTFCRKHGVSLSRFPQVEEYIAYVLEAERIDKNALLEEMDTLERAAETAVAKTPEEQDLVKAGKSLAQMKKLVDHALVPTEWMAYQKAQRDMEETPQILARLGGGGDLTIPKEWVLPFEGFYTQALTRNNALVQRLLEKMKTENQTAAALVAGGFHTQGLTELCRKRGISYAVVSPRLTQVPQGGPALDVFTRAPLPLEKLLVGDRLFLASARVTQSGQSPILQAQNNGPLVQSTAQVTWSAFQAVLAEWGESFRGEDLKKYQEFAAGFPAIESIRSQKTTVRSQSALILRVTLQSGGEREFVVLAFPEDKASLINENGPPALFEGTLHQKEGPVRLRIESMQEGVPDRLNRFVEKAIESPKALAAHLKSFLRKALVPRTVLLERTWKSREELEGAISNTAQAVGEEVQGYPPIQMRALRSLVSFALGEVKDHGVWKEVPAQLKLIHARDFLELRMEVDSLSPLPNEGRKNLRNKTFSIQEAQKLIHSARGVESGSGAGTAYVASYFTQLYEDDVPDTLVRRARMAWKQEKYQGGRYRVSLIITMPMEITSTSQGPSSGTDLTTITWVGLGVLAALSYFAFPGESSLFFPFLLATKKSDEKLNPVAAVLTSQGNSEPLTNNPLLNSPDSVIGSAENPDKTSPPAGDPIPVEKEAQMADMRTVLKDFSKNKELRKKFLENPQHYIDLASEGTPQDRFWAVQILKQFLDLNVKAAKQANGKTGKENKAREFFDIAGPLAQLYVSGPVNGMDTDERLGKAQKLLGDMNTRFQTVFSPGENPTDEAKEMFLNLANMQLNLAERYLEQAIPTGAQTALEKGHAHLEALERMDLPEEMTERFQESQGVYFILSGWLVLVEFDALGEELDDLSESSMKNLNTAVSLFEEGLNLFPDSDLGHAKLAGAYFRLGELERATEEIDRALKLTPHFGDALSLQGEVAIALSKTVVEKDKAGAQDLLKEALKTFHHIRTDPEIEGEGLSLERLRLNEVRALLRLARWASGEEPSDPGENWEDQARDLLDKAIQGYLNKTPGAESPSPGLLRQWLIHIKTRKNGIEPGDLDLLLDHKKGKEFLGLVHTIAEVTQRISDNHGQSLPEAIESYGSDPEKTNNARTAAAQILLIRNDKDRLNRLFGKVLQEGKGDLLAEMAWALEDHLDALTMPHLISLLDQKELKKHKDLVRKIQGVLESQQEPIKKGLERLFEKEFVVPSQMNLEKTIALREETQNLRERLEALQEQAKSFRLDLGKDPWKQKINDFQNRLESFLQQIEGAEEAQALARVQKELGWIPNQINHIENNDVEDRAVQKLELDLKLAEEKIRKQIEAYPSVKSWFEGLRRQFEQVQENKTGRIWADWKAEAAGLLDRLDSFVFEGKKTEDGKFEEIDQKLNVLKKRLEALAEQQEGLATLSNIEKTLKNRKMESQLRADLQGLNHFFDDFSLSELDARQSEINQKLEEILARYGQGEDSPLRTPALAALAEDIRGRLGRMKKNAEFAIAWQERVLALAARYQAVVEGKFPAKTEEGEDSYPDLGELKEELVAIQLEGEGLRTELQDALPPQEGQRSLVEGSLPLLEGVNNGIVELRKFVDFDLVPWVTAVDSLIQRREKAEGRFVNSIVLLVQELTGIVHTAQELKEEMSDHPYSSLVERYYPDLLADLDQFANPPVSGGRWPWLDGLYRRVGGWTGLVFLPVLVESVLVPWALGFGLGLDGGAGLWAVVAYQALWHGLHLPGGNADLAFSREKGWISLGAVGSAALMAFGGLLDPTGTSLWVTWGVLSLPHFFINHALYKNSVKLLDSDVEPVQTESTRLQEVLLGGEARRVLTVNHFVFSRGELSQGISAQTQQARGERETLALLLGLETNAAPEEIIFQMGLLHKEGKSLNSILKEKAGPKSLEEQQARDLGRFLENLDRVEQVEGLLAIYHRAQGLLSAKSRLGEAFEDVSSPRWVIQEISDNLLENNSVLTGQDETIVERLKDLNTLTSAQLEKVRWVVPGHGRSQKVHELFSRLRLGRLQNTAKEKSVISLEGQQKSLGTLLTKAQGEKNPQKLNPADIYLLNPADWNTSDLPPVVLDKIHILVLLAGNLVMDMTTPLATDLKRITIVTIQA